MAPSLQEAGERAFRSLFGAEVPVTLLLISVCLLLQGLGMLTGPGGSLLSSPPASSLLRWGALHSSLAADEPWRFASAVFVHAGLIHLLLNMSALYSLGSALERQVGSGRTSILFVASGVFGFIVSLQWARFGGSPLFTLGSSGAIFGLSGALVGHLAASRNPAWKPYLVQTLVLAAVLAILPMRIDNAAHLGGLAAGVALGFAFRKERRPRRQDRLFGWLGAGLIALSLAAIVLSDLSSQWRIQQALEALTSGF